LLPLERDDFREVWIIAVDNMVGFGQLCPFRLLGILVPNLDKGVRDAAKSQRPTDSAWQIPEREIHFPA